RVREAARRDHLEVREPPLLADRHLGGPARLGRRGIEAVALAQPPLLQLGGTVDDDHAVEPEMDAGSDEQRGIRDEHRSRAAVGGPRPPRLLLAHAWMDERVQARARAGIDEDEIAEPFPVDGPVGAEDRRAERAHHVVVGGAAGRHHVAGDGVEVQRLEARRGEPAQDVRLPTGDAAGEAHPQDARPSLRSRGMNPRSLLSQGGYSPPRTPAARTVFFMSIAIVSGPTPPGTGVSAPATSRTDGACTSPTST